MSFLDPEPDQTEKKEVVVPSLGKQKVIRTVLMTLGAMALVGLGAMGVYWGVRQRPEWFGIKNEDNAQSQAELDSIVAEAGKIIQLPEGEIPTLATVTELDKVKDQEFFRNAQNGDKVLIYQGARKAYLYRPSEKKIIEVGVVNINQQQGEVAGENQDIEVLSPTPNTTGQVSPTITDTFEGSLSPTPISSPTPIP